jgi:hypothetical protein
MNTMQKHQAALAHIDGTLEKALQAQALEPCRECVSQALRLVERLSRAIALAPIQSGRKGGLATAQRGPEYFRKIAAMRKTRAGGRPRKTD